MITRLYSKIPAALIMLLMSVHLSAATVKGAVFDSDGKTLAGAQVTLTSADGLFAETVYANNSGEFTLTTKQADATQLRARMTGFADAYHSIDFSAGDESDVQIKLRRLMNKQEISDNLTASAHFTRIKMADPEEAGFFRIECLTCHQLGNAYTRMQRSRDRWVQIVERMLGFYGVKDQHWTDRYVDVLSGAFDGTPLDIRQQQVIDPVIFSARISQWKLPLGNIAHDVEYHAADGKFYTVDQGSDQIYITDPVSNITETFKIPAGDIPTGGKFLKMYNEPNPFSLAVSRGPHSLQQGPDGRFYITDTVSGQIGVFDPKTRAYTGYDIGGKAMYPHTLRFDAKGRVWFTLGSSNQLGRFDPISKEMIRIDLPTTSDRPEFPLSMPYGIDIHPRDGSVWYTRLMANRIGRIDPETLQIEEFQPPLIGPRRMRFARDGTLWIPAYGSGTLVRLDTGTMKYTEYPIPGLSPEEVEVPYAVGVHPATQEVWITANMSDRMFRFLPGEERFIAYPLPTRGIFLRDVIFTPDGRVCASSSMAAAPLAVEGGMEEVICIDPGKQG